jgi:hypothetical protein
MQQRGELSETDCAIEQTRAAREALDLAHDHAEAVFVTRPEHLGLRPPRVCGDRSFSGHLGIANAVRLSYEPHGLVMRTQYGVSSSTLTLSWPFTPLGIGLRAMPA